MFLNSATFRINPRPPQNKNEITEPRVGSMNTFISGEDGTVSYPARWTARGGPARWTTSATSWGGACLGGGGRVVQGGCRWALVWTPCGSAEMMGRGVLPGGRWVSEAADSDVPRCQLHSAPQESGRQGTGTLRSCCSPRVPGPRGRFSPWPPRDRT